jgi:MATE family multidrug resistance protein
VATAALWAFIPALFGAFGHAPEVLAMETGYTRIRMLSMAPAGINCALGHFFIGVHKPHVNTISVIVSNAVNAVLSYALVLGKWGFPAMGVEGAAVGTVIATAIRTLWLMDALCLRKVSAVFEATSTCRLDLDKMRRLLKIGWPAGMAFALDIGAWSTFFVVVVGRLGTVEMAASATCWRFTELSFMPAIGIGMAVSALVGRAIGEGRPDLARYRTRLGMTLNVCYMGTMGLIFVTAGSGMMRIFSDDASVIALGTSLMGLVAVFQLFDSVAITYSCALRGAGDTLWPAVAGATLSWGVMIGGGLTISYLRPEYGAKGPWLFATLFLLAIGTTLYLRWRYGRWETLDVIGRTEPQPAEYDASITETVIAHPALPPDEPAPDLDVDPAGDSDCRATHSIGG